MYRKNIYLIVFLTLSIVSWSQNTIENDPELIQNSIDYHINQAQTSIENHNYYEVLSNLDTALAYAEKANLKKSIGIIYTFKGRLELILDTPDDAIKSINKSINIQREINDNANLAKSFKTLGLVYSKKKSYHQALNYFLLAKKLFQDQKLTNNIIESLLLEGHTLILLKSNKEALTPIEEAIERSKENGIPNLLSDALIKQGAIYHQLNDNTKAMKYTLEGLQLADKHKLSEQRINAFLTLSNINNSLRRYKKSRLYLKSYLNLSDSIRNLSKKSITNIEAGVNNAFLEVKDELTKTNQKLKQQEQKNNRNTLITFLSIALLIILSLVTFLLHKNNNIRLQTNIMLHKKNKELVLAKEKAELASKTKANFLSTVTHELRTPLYAITGLSTLLLEENPKPEQIKHLKSLKFSGDHLLTFINDILQINKIEANKLSLDLQPYNLNDKIKNTILALKNSAKNNNTKIHLTYDKYLPKHIIGDQLKISQILINLIGNAIKFTKNGTIQVRVSSISKTDSIHMVRFEIEDNGIGISKEKQAKMFESFNQGSIQINRKYGGTGLGLYIVKGLIKVLNGQISFKSELEKGTTFTFEIPLKANKALENKRPNFSEGDEKEVDPKKIQILVVEDNKINQMITQRQLNKMDLICHITDNGEDAIQMVKDHNYNLVLMDIHMPGISGIEATKKIRAFDKNIIIFALTAVTIEDKMAEFYEAGFTDLITKPFKPDEFQNKLYQALSQ